VRFVGRLELAQRADEEGVPTIPIGSCPFPVFDTIDYDEVAILHVRYGARRSPWE
jgi:hypothetical protein